MLERPKGRALPRSHALRQTLNDEVHARPPEALQAPCRITYLVLMSGTHTREELQAPVLAFAERYNVEAPEPAANHYRVDTGDLRLKWERHTEFARYMLIAPGVPAGFEETPLDLLPAEWVTSLPGELLVATHAILLPHGLGEWDLETVSRNYFDGNPLVGASIAGGAGSALTDFRIHADGFSRILAENKGMNVWQAGRLMQRLFEIDTYRMLALLAFPIARELGPFLLETERELADIARGLNEAGDEDEQMLLDQLTRLQAAMENRYAETDFRLSAARAYYDLVKQRIAELREERIQGLQTFAEFMARRLAPAMNTCETMNARQGNLSQRVARATQLLSTRVEVHRANQSQAVLKSMNQRAGLQLRLQEAVETLSIAAVTYYTVSLIGYVATAIAEAGLGLGPDSIAPSVVMGISIPVVIAAVALIVLRVRKSAPGPNDFEL